jgi:hypothetical protein
MSGDGVINETLVFSPGNLMRKAGANPSNIVPTLGAMPMVLWKNELKSPMKNFKRSLKRM